MLKSIYDMNISDYDMKRGDIKIDSEELRDLFLMLKEYRIAFEKKQQEWTEEEQREFAERAAITEYLQNKYIVMADLRFQQNKWYEILKKLDNKEFTKEATLEEVDNLRREVWGLYMDAKGKREELTRELEKRKKELDR